MGDKNAKIALFSVSSLLLVAVVGTITYGVTMKNGQDDSSQPLSKSLKAKHEVCKYTDYMETCVKSLDKVQDEHDPNHIAHVAFQATIDAIKQISANSSLLKEAATDPRVSQAFEICKEVLDDSIDDLEKSIAKIENNGVFSKGHFDTFVHNLPTWLSGAGTYLETCLDAFQNTTGDSGEKMKELMKESTELTSNAMAIVAQLGKVLSTIHCPAGLSLRRRILEDGCNGHKRHLLEAKPSTLAPNAVVALDGSGQFKSIQEAVNTAPKNLNKTFIILVKAGVYQEYVEIPKKAYNVMLIGEGPSKTMITGNKNYADGTATYKTATVAVNGDNFIARDISFENTAGAIKHQAVALRVSADQSIFYNCHIDGYQDTLYAHNHRQFYRHCTITGTIDFIFGDAAAVFQNCKLVVRKPLDNQSCMVTAQGRKDPRGKGAIVLQNCTITAEQAFLDTKPMPEAYLGRPWKEYSRTIVMQSFIDNIIDPKGWSPWAGIFALNTLSYAEYQNRGPGSNIGGRVQWKGIKDLSSEQAMSFTPASYIGGDDWIEGTSIPYEPGMMKLTVNH